MAKKLLQLLELNEGNATCEPPCTAVLLKGVFFICAGKTMAENLEQLPGLKAGQQVIMPVDKPIKSSGHLQVRTIR